MSPGGERRRTISWNQVPTHLADAVTAVEDKTFWANTGIDPIGIISSAVDTLTGDPRGGSTITQQLVRQKLLPDEVTNESSRLGDRKVKEIMQSIRVTDYYRGEEGKQAILTAYLNQNFYGNNSYGVLAAASSYFGVHDLDDLTLAQAATLAAIPQAPSTYDLVRNAVKNEEGEWEVPADSAIYQRRNLVLSLLADDPTRRVLSGDTYCTQDYLEAMRRAHGHRGPERQRVEGAALRVVRARRADRDALPRGRDLRHDQQRRPARDHHARPQGPQQGGEVGRGDRPASRTATTPPTRPGSWACPMPAGCSGCAPRTSGTRRSRPSTTRPARSSPTWARPTTTSGPRSTRRCSRSTTCSARAGGSRAPPSSPSPMPRASTIARSPQPRCSWT